MNDREFVSALIDSDVLREIGVEAAKQRINRSEYIRQILGSELSRIGPDLHQYLPEVPAIYFLVQLTDAEVRIGKTSNLRQAITELELLSDTQLAWVEIPEALYPKWEKASISVPKNEDD